MHLPLPLEYKVMVSSIKRETTLLLHDRGKNKLKVFTWKTILKTPPFSKILLVARFTLLWRHDGHAHRTAALTSLWLPTGASTFSPRHTTVENPLGNPASSTTKPHLGTTVTCHRQSLIRTPAPLGSIWQEGIKFAAEMFTNSILRGKPLLHNAILFRCQDIHV